MSKMNASQSRKGKILRVKHGYNPNSSSMGSIVFILPASLLAVTVGFGAVSSVIFSMLMKADNRTPQKHTEEKKNENV